MIELRVLGSLQLTGADGAELRAVLTQPKRLALLAYLAIERPGEFHRRDSLLALFWPEFDEDRARAALRRALHFLRRTLGADIVLTRGDDDVALDPGRLACDVLAFAQRCDAGDHAAALALYRGDLLDGFFVSDAPEFDRWLGERRAALRARAIESAWRVASDAREPAAVDAWRRLVALEPYASRGTLGLMAALERAGDRGGALQCARRHADLLRTELDAAPDAAVDAYARRLRDATPVASSPVVAAMSVAAAPVAPTSDAVASEAPSLASPSLAHTAIERPRRRLAAAVVVAVVGLSVLGVVAVAPTARRASTGAPPRVALVAMRSLRGDSGSRWLEAGLPLMIAAQLGRAWDVEVLPPQRVVAPGAATAEELARIGRRLGATYVVSGAYARGDTLLALDLSVVDVALGRQTTLRGVTARDEIRLADAAAARVLENVGAARPGMHLDEVETQSVEAYEHFVRGTHAGLVGDAHQAREDLDAAIALDSGFVSALTARMLMAEDQGERAIAARLRPLLARYAARATVWDRMEVATRTAFVDGDAARSEALGRALVARFPRDQRAYSLLADILHAHGQWGDAEALLRRALDVASRAGDASADGCARCAWISALVSVTRDEGHLDEEERLDRQWLALQPENPTPLFDIADLLVLRGRVDEALAAAVHAATIVQRTGSPPTTLSYVVSRPVQILIRARRLDAADSAIRALGGAPSPVLRAASLDLRATLERERGRFRASLRTLDALHALDPSANDVLLMIDDLAHVEDYAAIRRLVDSRFDRLPPTASWSDVTGWPARGFTWWRAVLADALAPVADTLWLRAKADSLERVGPTSYYGRDWRLHHHVRGLIAKRAGRWNEAAAEFAASHFSAMGWTRSMAEQADALVAVGRPAEAIAVLRAAYVPGPESMGRYVPTSEIDYRMALAFRAAGQPDSAARYAGYARRAWTNADPEVRRRLAELDR